MSHHGASPAGASPASGSGLPRAPGYFFGATSYSQTVSAP